MPEQLWDDETRTEIAKALSGLRDPVRLLLFLDDEPACQTCETQQRLLEMLAELSERIDLEIHHLSHDEGTAAEYGVDKVPATIPLADEDHGIRFFGLTVGEEFTSLLQAILMLSIGRTSLDPGLEELIKTIDRPVHIQVFVTLTCPYCPAMVQTAHQFAYVNPGIRADIIEASEFLELAHEYGVEAVPRTIINETTAVEGVYPPAAFYLALLQAVEPDNYRRLEAELRDAEGLRSIVALEEGHVYDVVIVGGGPAGLSAALYAARKNLDVGLVAEKLGGQLLYTAQVDNYLGLPGIGGTELLQRFQFHAESYPLAELLGVNVAEVQEAHGGFLIYTQDGHEIAAHSVIYCAGKEYKRLGVPNEERLIGRGIAFCATCDAPLYRGRRVAVVGGGNSAFTAVRDLLAFASEVHLIHRRQTFSADAALVDEIRGHPTMIFHTPYEVVSFIGDAFLEGVGIVSRDDKMEETLEVDGVFLEIGLSPNSGPVKALIELNERGEISVHADRSTSLPGFFAAGDVTDIPEKQISVAVGHGALAALSAYEYLAERGVVIRRPELESAWSSNGQMTA